MKDNWIALDVRVTTQALDALFDLHTGWHVCKNEGRGATDYDASDMEMGDCPTWRLLCHLEWELRQAADRGEIVHRPAESPRQGPFIDSTTDAQRRAERLAPCRVAWCKTQANAICGATDCQRYELQI